MPNLDHLCIFIGESARKMVIGYFKGNGMTPQYLRINEIRYAYPITNNCLNWDEPKCRIC